MLKRLIQASVVLASFGGLTSPASAQQQNILLMGQAITDCQADPTGHLGYADEQICIQARYETLLEQSHFAGGPPNPPTPGQPVYQCGDMSRIVICKH